MVTVNGSHGLSCGLGPGRLARHATINDIISRSLTETAMPNIEAPPGLCRTVGERPDGLTLIPWRGGAAYCMERYHNRNGRSIIPTYDDGGHRCSSGIGGNEKDHQVYVRRPPFEQPSLCPRCFRDPGPYQ